MQPQHSGVLPRVVPHFVPNDPTDVEATHAAQLRNLELSTARAAAEKAEAANDQFSPDINSYLILLHSMSGNSLAEALAKEQRIHLAPASEPQPHPQPQPQSFWNRVSNRLFPFMGGRTKRSKRSKKHSKRSKKHSKRSKSKHVKRRTTKRHN